jgi:hypothetical protein
MFGFVLLIAVAALPCQNFDKMSNPTEVRQEVQASADPSVNGLVWNRWTSKNFTVCSLNDRQAGFLNDNLEKVKSWVMNRWGLPDEAFTSECRLLCVDDASVFKKLFNLTDTKVEIRREGGKIKMTIIFLLLNDLPSKTIPMPLTEICLAEFEQKNNLKLGVWAKRGIARLNCSIPEIRQQLTRLNSLVNDDKGLYFGKALFEMKDEQYLKESPENQKVFDYCAQSACLMLRKEFGQDKFQKFLTQSNPEEALKSIYGFAGYAQFDGSFKQYMKDLSNDVAGVNGRSTPDHYLQVLPK